MVDSEINILKYFQILKKRDLMGTSYLFVGENSLPPGIIKIIACKEDEKFCDSCWDCRKINDLKHPDLMILEPQGMTLKLEQIKEGIRFLSLRSFRLDKKILILRKAQSLGTEAANAFLKTLEEPPRGAFIALCVSKTEGVIPTIISRCRKIYLFPRREEVDSSPQELVYGFLKGEDIKIREREKFASFLLYLIILVRNKLLSLFGAEGERLSLSGEYEIILNSYPSQLLEGILKDLLKIYDAHKNININLALHIIRLKMRAGVST
ncbi:MAG: hypothetical protein GF375_06625 [Candidatus Omnitrophica bacterium]|nr:hypothetical protein [Candidatus Omnitrophota bacterium]MBD3269648.1 hypothetical protein [Candidatus Omnitrophota bacterium]